MSELNLARALERARALGASSRRPRSDRRRARIDPLVEARLQALLATRDRPSISAVFSELEAFCGRRRLELPARSSIYNAIGRARARELAWSSLPGEVQQALYNLRAADADQVAPPARVPADQVVLHAFNYGSLRAISFASSLDWVALLRASERRGWRPKSRALLGAVMQARGIV